eukprot:CAMPEP_0172516666 /NCGR_PEP_ID=MMETSP1066-20121228/278160_1 /TAXON_ID=671091 /ORGANISM="Coscinodiscus wailesii, Strain CCMP2513" /LENGTH=195 /DNA_ID=CAMNT_0013298251 /DNA_START=86 /DNA_END=673 /DNA_ORIENTATION=-
MGVVYEDQDECGMKDRQKAFCEEAKKRIMKLCQKAITMINPVCDQMAKRFLSDRLPPSLTTAETKLTPTNHIITPNTMVRLLRPTIARLVIENNETTTDNGDATSATTSASADDGQKAVIYHCMDNSREEHHGNPLSPLEFEVDDAPALETLMKTVEPYWVMVGDLFHEGGDEEKVEIVKSLYDEGIIAVWEPNV